MQGPLGLGYICMMKAEENKPPPPPPQRLPRQEPDWIRRDEPRPQTERVPVRQESD